MGKKTILLTIVLLVSLLLVLNLSLTGCIRVYPDSERAEGEPPPGEEPPPEEEFHNEEEPPPGEEPHNEEEPPPEPGDDPGQQNNNQQQSNLSEEEIKRRVFNAAQYEIEHNSIYKNVVFDTEYDPNFMNKVTGFDYKYECGLEFEALDTNVNKQGRFVWVFVVSYDPGSDKCFVETGSMQNEYFF